MRMASRVFSVQEKETIKRAVAEAERRTSGEIVPVMATVSGHYHRAEDIFGVLTGLLFVSLAWIFFQRVEPVQGIWASGHAVAVGLISVLLSFTAGFIVGAAAASHFPILKHPFLTGHEMKEEVARSAAVAFERFRMDKTQGGSGILIYVSLFERMVCVQGDEAIGKKISQSDWNEVRDSIIEGIRANRPCDGFCRAISKCGDLLAEHLPIQPNDVNELSNELRLID